MFSANENILLRQHKRKVIEYIESTIPSVALDMGTTVMVMQVSCRQPGCVPLETAVTIVFPKPPRKTKKSSSDSDDVPMFPQPLIPGLPESQTGGSFKTRILKPLSEVTNDDVLDALPPSFAGGRRTTKSLCLKARDTLFAQIGQIVGEDDDSAESRRLVAEYLNKCLGEYVERGCVPPEWGEEFAPLDEKKDESSEEVQGNGSAKVTMDEKWGKGNVVFRRPVDDKSIIQKKQERTIRRPSGITRPVGTNTPSALSSQQLLQKMTNSEHAPGIRRAGCPCCEPDGASTYADRMMI